MTRTARYPLSVVAAPAIVAAARLNRSRARAAQESRAPRQPDGTRSAATPPGTGAPCGISEAATQPHTTLTPGAAITVTWEETVNAPRLLRHRFLAGQRRELLRSGREVAHEPARAREPDAGEPAAVVARRHAAVAPCTKCTLRLRQSC